MHLFCDEGKKKRQKIEKVEREELFQSGEKKRFLKKT
jgi:hypothetical protein